MRTLVALAVMVAASTHQASSTLTYGSLGPAYGSHAHGISTHATHSQGNAIHGGQTYSYGQPGYVGPLASSVPAGVGGKVIPVSDTYEVEAARGQFFRNYQDQLNTINAIRASRPSRYGHANYAPQPSYGSARPVPVAHSVSAQGVRAPHSTYGQASAPVQVSDTAEVAAAKADFFRLFNQQAAAAAAAPDDYTHYKQY
ncbi:cuticle protein CP1499-like [Portunus trituberculatus]|uniref:cuticle protein CP1499-like n=1 Tax=Portunus trituberculatus TaxID=210409 RepID=UPI001E1CE30A|nr:cuticle protein CP1499-like [Portunus trituberculatus]